MSQNSPRQNYQAFKEWQTWAINKKIIKAPKKKKVAPPIWSENWNG